MALTIRLPSQKDASVKYSLALLITTRYLSLMSFFDEVVGISPTKAHDLVKLIVVFVFVFGSFGGSRVHNQGRQECGHSESGDNGNG